MTGVLGYRELATDVSAPTDDDAVFVCGHRCAAEVALGAHRFGRAATSPVDVLESLKIEILGERESRVRLFPNHVEKIHLLDDQLTAQTRWFAAAEQPCLVMWMTVTNPGLEQRRIEVTARGCYNVNYVSKFRSYPNDEFTSATDRFTVRDTRFPALHAITGTRPLWDVAPVAPQSREPSTVATSWSYVIMVEPGAESDLAIAVGGSDRAGAADAAVDAVVADPAAAYESMITGWERRTRSGVGLDCGRPVVDQLFAAAKVWAHKDSRLVPLGPPYALGRNDNAELLALTASPDYHGIFANDNAQSCWELGALGPDLYPVLENTLDILIGFGAPESVEIDPIDATGTPWLSPLRIGERPQWVIGASALVLWSGRYADRFWPHVRQLLSRFRDDDDRDGDWLDDYSSSPFPEQPDPGRHHHEMLYASAFWHQAFTLGAELASYVGDTACAADYVTSAARIGEAVEDRFGTPYGYASWLDADHEQHPHRGHTMVLPLQYEMATPERAALTFDTLLHGPLWSSDGPLAMEPAYPDPGGPYAWGFLRWNLVDALFRYGRTTEAAELLERWAAHEAGLHFQAPEGFPTVTGVTGKGYVWTAGRSLRAVLFGLCGIRLRAEGLVLVPQLPDDWGPIRLQQLPFRGATYDITIERGVRRELLVDGVSLPPETPITPRRAGARHAVTVRTTGS